MYYRYTKKAEEALLRLLGKVDLPRQGEVREGFVILPVLGPGAELEFPPMMDGGYEPKVIRLVCLREEVDELISAYKAGILR